MPSQGLFITATVLLLTSQRVGHVGQISCSGGATTISPCGTSADTLTASAKGIRTFSVHNASNTDHRYTPSCSVTTPLDSCTIAPVVLSVSAGQSASITVSYIASASAATGHGNVIVAVDGGAPNQVATVVAVDVSQKT